MRVLAERTNGKRRTCGCSESLNTGCKGVNEENKDKHALDNQAIRPPQAPRLAAWLCPDPALGWYELDPLIENPMEISFLPLRNSLERKIKTS